MTHSKYTDHVTSTPNSSSRNGRAITGWIVHHNASTNGEAVLQMMQTGSKQVSAQYQIMADGVAWSVVPEERSSWSVSNQNWDGASITFEVENISGAPSWGISEASIEKVAAIIADSSKRYGIPINTATVRGHNQGSGTGGGGSYATACPGPSMPINRIIDMANGIKTAGLDPKPIEIKKEDEDMTRLYMDKSNGHVRAINAATGHDYHIPSEAYLDLVIGNKFYDKWEPAEGGDRRADAGHYKIVGHNEFEYLRKIAAFQRGEISWEDTTK